MTQTQMRNNKNKNKFNLIFIILLLLCSKTCYSISIREKTQDNLTFNKSVSLLNNSLREKHLKNISLIENYLTTFAQVGLNQDNTSDNIKYNLKQFFKKMGDNVNQVSSEFKENKETCENKLKNFDQVCKESIEEMKENIDFNKEYADSLSNINKDYDRVIADFYNANLYPIAKNVCGGEGDVTTKNDVVNVYTSISKHLDNHFHIFKSKEMQQILVQVDTQTEEKLDNFLASVLNKYKQDPTEGDYVAHRHNMAQILFNKISTYMTNSIERKSKLLEQSEDILMKMKHNDQVLRKQIELLKKQRKDNSELALSLHKDNQLTLKNIKQCADLENVKAQCEESGHLYRTIISSYEKQTKAIQNLYKDLSPNEEDTQVDII